MDGRTGMSASRGKNCSVLGLYSHFSKKNARLWVAEFTATLVNF